MTLKKELSNPVVQALIFIVSLTLLALVIQEARGEEYYLIPLFSLTVGERNIPVWITNDPDTVCNHNNVNGCVLDMGIITVNPWKYDRKGCTTLGHELYHVWGYAENEIPLCERNQEFRLK